MLLAWFTQNKKAESLLSTVYFFNKADIFANLKKIKMRVKMCPTYYTS